MEPRVAQKELSLNCSICSDNEARFYDALGLGYVIGAGHLTLIVCTVFAAFSAGRLQPALPQIT